jgi:hypothetical protein
MERNEYFLREPSRTTPYAKVNFATGEMEIRGRSCPENTLEFYEPIFTAIKKLSNNNIENVTANFRMLYFNTSSARCFFMIIKLLKKLKESGKNVIINWYADEDDEDMQETGMDYQEIVEIEFNIHLVDESQLV